MKRFMKLFSIILILIMLISPFQPEDGCSTMSNPAPRDEEIIIEE